MNADPALAIAAWAAVGLVVWLVLGVLVALIVARFIAIGDYDERSAERPQPRHVAPRAARPRLRVPRQLQARRGGLLCRPGRPCTRCERATCVVAPCCPHCRHDPTNDQM